MKRYENMSKEEILDFIAGCGAKNCQDCPANIAGDMLSAQCVEKYLNEEVPEPLMVRRFQNICCKQDLLESADITFSLCAKTDCLYCEYSGPLYCQVLRFIDYLGELEPERPAEWYKDAKYDKSKDA